MKKKRKVKLVAVPPAFAAVTDSRVPLNTALTWAAERLAAMRPGEEEARAWATVRDATMGELAKMFGSGSERTRSHAIKAALRLMDIQRAREASAYVYLAKAAEAAGVIQATALQVEAMREPDEIPKTLGEALGKAMKA